MGTGSLDHPRPGLRTIDPVQIPQTAIGFGFSRCGRQPDARGAGLPRSPLGSFRRKGGGLVGGDRLAQVAIGFVWRAGERSTGEIPPCPACHWVGFVPKPDYDHKVGGVTIKGRENEENPETRGFLRKQIVLIGVGPNNY